MKLSDLTCCPFCEAETGYYENIYLHGSTHHYSGYDGEFNSSLNSEMFDSLLSNYSGRVYCQECNKYIGNHFTDRLSKAAKDAIKHRNTMNNADK